MSLVTCPGSQTLSCRWLKPCEASCSVQDMSPHLTGLTRSTEAPGSWLRDRTAEALERRRVWGTVWLERVTMDTVRRQQRAGQQGRLGDGQHTWDGWHG